MPALPADIARATRAARIARRDDAAIAARYPGARTQDGPARGYFDSVADADAALAQRAALIGTERRRFAVTVQDLAFFDPATDPLPSVRLVDAEQGIDAWAMVARIELSPDGETTSYEVFG